MFRLRQHSSIYAMRDIHEFLIAQTAPGGLPSAFLCSPYTLKPFKNLRISQA
jgi:hypothetical protein